ncbi:ComEC/Rec2 family competence protein [Parabacteroides sp. OttesenSCG-928-J18]|nr:ComEC/Rec2 family competence protein [Parabacteroides sp. OttesenSCG-928-J18]
MIAEIQKRPFVRLLLFWTTGILLAMNLRSNLLVGGLLLFPFCLFISTILIPLFYKPTLAYAHRWRWGCVIAFLIMALAALHTISRDDTLSSPPSLVEENAILLRQGFVESIDELSLSEEEKSFLATILLGYRESLQRETREKFAATGISHILAVSGFHVAIVCGFITALFGWLPKSKAGIWIRYLLTMALLWVFVVTTGMAPSAIRAGIMLSFYLTGRVFRRESDSYNTLAAAAFCMLVYNPQYLLDIGFQLSYTAVFFILYLRPFFDRIGQLRNPIIRTLWQWLTVCLSAQLGTTFLSLFYFKRFSLVFVLANLPVMLFSTLLIPMGLLWLLLPGFIPLQIGVEKLTHWTIEFVYLLYELPGASVLIPFDLFSLITGYSALLAGLVYLFKRRPWQLILCFSLFALLLIEPLIH